jgi:MerR family transcriptional regulator/heat shock protein HspR
MVKFEGSDPVIEVDSSAQWVSYEWIESRFNISRSTLRMLVREGLISPIGGRPEPCLSKTMVDRLEFILYLQRELGVNKAGVGIILDMKSRLEWHVRRQL